MLSKVDLVAGPAVSVATSNEAAIGNYTITVDVHLTEYPEKTTQYEFRLQIDPAYTGPEGIDTVAVDKSAPVLNNNDIGTTFKFTIGDPWYYELQPFDADGDLTDVKVELGRASTFIEYDPTVLALRIQQDDVF